MSSEPKRSEIEQRVKKVIAAQLDGVDVSEVTEESDFIKDLGADSLDVVQLVIAMEEEFDLGEIPDEEAEKIRTVKDVIDYLEERLSA